MIKKDPRQEFANAAQNGGKWEEKPITIRLSRAAIKRLYSLAHRESFAYTRSKVVRNTMQLDILFVKAFTGMGSHRVTIKGIYDKGLDITAVHLMNEIDNIVQLKAQRIEMGLYS